MKADKVQKHAINDNVTHNCFFFLNKLAQLLYLLQLQPLWCPQQKTVEQQKTSVGI